MLPSFVCLWCCLVLDPGHRQRAKPGEEPGDLGKIRSKLLQFLKRSQHYEAFAHISSFPDDGECRLALPLLQIFSFTILCFITSITPCSFHISPTPSSCPSLPLPYPHLPSCLLPPDLFEERALLLSRLGRHEVALAIYAHVLKEPEMAEE